ncbi:Tectonin beta-propeller repeat-containing protein [Eumeta japonica]|uniref:Tectonin beta-propeller repeat-containing protein n=1 Tax=Eumeta variegata TaxID=151549 RepID=A0A4C1T355_EUMVA|nr:Tectonin beta-propeller repeat-containing protein [Eumeta japonica]
MAATLHALSRNCFESTHASSAPAAEVAEVTGKAYETQLKNPRAWSPECEVMWSCIAAGAVTVDSCNMPNWFNEQSSTDARLEIDANWRKHILNQLKERQEKINALPNLSKYEKAIELSSWIKSAEARYQRPNSLEFEDCRIELEWVSGNSASTPTTQNPTTQKDTDSGTFTVLHPDGVTTKIQFSLAAITCVQCCSEPASPRLAIHASCLAANCSPVRLQFGSDAEMEDWLSHLPLLAVKLMKLWADQIIPFGQPQI